MLTILWMVILDHPRDGDLTIHRELTAQTILGTVAILRDRDKEHPCNVDRPRNVDYTTNYDPSNLI